MSFFIDPDFERAYSLRRECFETHFILILIYCIPYEILIFSYKSVTTFIWIIVRKRLRGPST